MSRLSLRLSKEMCISKPSFSISYAIFLQLLFASAVVCMTRHISATRGGQQILDCDIYPAVIDTTYYIQWRKNNLTDPVFFQYDNYPEIVHKFYQGRIRLLSQGQLQVSDIRERDEGWYECKIIPIHIKGKDEATINGSWIHLSVLSAPKITRTSPKYQRIMESSNVTLFCYGSGSPHPVLTWSKDRMPMRSSYRVRIRKNFVTITGVRRSDAGTYICTFRNRGGEVSQLLKVVIDGAIYISQNPSNHTLRLQQTVHLSCSIEGSLNNISVSWFFNDQPITIHYNYLKKMKVILIRRKNEYKSQLTIKFISRLEMGWYRCEVTNGQQVVESTAAYVNVVYKPVPEGMPKIKYWGLTDTGLLSCYMRANPPVIQYHWSKTPGVIDGPRFTPLPNGTLVVRSVQSGDAGIYECSATNSMGRGDEAKVQVEVRNLPRFDRTPQPVYQLNVGDTVTMPCNASGSPNPIISWDKDGHDISETQRISVSRGRLTIRNIIKQDYGYYHCKATNQISSIVRQSQLIVEGTTPHAPTNITVVTGVFDAEISWLPAYDGGSPQHYILWFRRLYPKENWRTMRVDSVHATSYTVYGLQPYTQYEFKLHAQNRHGDMPSQSKTAFTKGYSPGAVTSLPHLPGGATYIPEVEKNIGPRPPKPKDVRVTVRGDTIFIKWTAPTSTHPPIYYFIIQKSEDNITWQQIAGKIHMPTTTYTWGEAVNGVTYSFRVFSYSVLSYSQPSHVVSVKFTQVPIYTNSNEDETKDSSDRNTHSQQSNNGSTDYGMIAGLAGSLGFIILAVAIGVIIYCYVSKRNKSASNAKYSSTPQDDPRSKHASEWDYYEQTDGGETLTKARQHSLIYTISNSSQMWAPNKRDSSSRQRRGNSPDGQYEWQKSDYQPDRKTILNGDASRYRVWPETLTYPRSQTVPYLREPYNVPRKSHSLMSRLPSAHNAPYHVTNHAHRRYDDRFDDSTVPYPIQETSLNRYPSDIRIEQPVPHKPPRLYLDSTLQLDRPGPVKSSSPLDIARSNRGSSNCFDHDSSDSSFRPMGYSRDQLQGAVERVRHNPHVSYEQRSMSNNSRQDEIPTATNAPFNNRRNGQHASPDDWPYHNSTAGSRSQRQESPWNHRSLSSHPSISSARDGEKRVNTVDRSTNGGNRPNGSVQYHPLERDGSASSGIGSRNNVNSGELSDLKRPSLSASSIYTHQEYDVSADSSPFMDAPSYNRRNISGDENYEFDAANARDVHSPNYRDSSGKMGRGYGEKDERSTRLMREFQEFREKQQQRLLQSQPFGMDSDML